MKVMLVGESPLCFTGSGKVLRYLANLPYELCYTCWGYDGSPHDFPYPIYPLRRKQDGEYVEEALQFFEPDTVVMFGDPWYFSYLPSLRKKFTRVKFILYLTIDAWPYPEAYRPILTACDYIAVCTLFGQRVLADAGFQSIVVPLGVDTNIFRVLPEPQVYHDRKVRSCLDKVVILWVGFNGIRKNPTAALETVKLLKEKWPVKLVMKTNVSGVITGRYLGVEVTEQSGFDLRPVANKLDLSWAVNDFHPDADVIFLDSVLSEEDMCRLYNLAHIFLSTSQAEGFCLPVMEAKACGTLTVANAAANLPEIAELTAPPAAKVMVLPGVYHLVPNPEALAQVITDYLEKGPPEGLKPVLVEWHQTVEMLRCVIEQPPTESINYAVL